MTVRVSKWLVALSLFAGTTFAQGSHGYAFLGPGSSSGRSGATILHVGGGGEVLTNLGIGIGAEGGYLFPPQSPDNGLGTGSLNGYYHFLDRGHTRWDPYVSGGYTALFRSTYRNAGNYGVGINYWISQSTGVKLEFRDHVTSSFNQKVHYWAFRVGVNFR